VSNSVFEATLEDVNRYSQYFVRADPEKKGYKFHFVLLPSFLLRVPFLTTFFSIICFFFAFFS